MSKLIDMFKEPKSVEELESENERKEYEVSIAKQNAMIKELEARGRKWQDFSSNGKKSGINFDRIASWFKGH